MGLTTLNNNVDPTYAEDPVQYQRSPKKRPWILGKSLQDIRKSARGALLSLAPYNIRYSELVAEGIDPDVLRELCQEVGIQVQTTISSDTVNKSVPTAQAHRPKTGSVISKNSVEIAKLPGTMGHDHPSERAPGVGSSSVTDEPYIQESSAERAQVALKTAIDDVQAGSINNSKNPSSLPGLSLSQHVSQDPSIATNIQQEDTSIPAPKQPDTVEARKDRIARMLAAKAGKSVPKPQSPVQTAPPQISKSKSVLEKRDSVEDSINSTAPSTELSRDELARPVNRGSSDEKTTAQTQLAFQKFEALKKRRLAEQVQNAQKQSTAEYRTSDEGVIDQVETTTSRTFQKNLDSQQQGSLAMTRQNLPRSSETLMFNQVDLPLTPGIPGLTMIAPSQQSSATLPARQVISPISATPDQVASAHLQPKTRKRPVASDFNDEPQYVTKRPFGQCRTSSVVIDVSDEENIGYDESDQMDIDKGDALQSQEANDEGSSRRAPRKSPSSTDSPQHFVSVSQSDQQNPSTVSGLQTASNMKSLAQMNEQILAMKKMVAEREAKRRAKQSLSRAQTPATPKQATSSTNPPSEAKAALKSPKLFGDKTSIETSMEAHPGDVSGIVNGIRIVTEGAELASSNITTQQAMIIPSRQSTPAESSTSDDNKLRRAALESGLSARDAEASKAKARLEEMQKELERYDNMKSEMEKLQQKLQQDARERQALVQELESLGMDTQGTTDGLSNGQLQAKKDELVEQQKADGDKNHDERGALPMARQNREILFPRHT